MDVYNNLNPPLSFLCRPGLHSMFCSQLKHPILTLSGPGAFCRQAKIEEPVKWIFLTFPKYVYTYFDFKGKKYCIVKPDRLAERSAREWFQMFEWGLQSIYV